MVKDNKLAYIMDIMVVDMDNKVKVIIKEDNNKVVAVIYTSSYYNDFLAFLFILLAFNRAFSFHVIINFLIPTNVV